MINFKEEIAKIISDVLEQNDIDIEKSIEIPKDCVQGDYAFPCFRLAKTLKKSPQMIAEDLNSKITLNNLIEKTEVVGGYLNFFVNKKELASTVIEEIKKKKEEYGKSEIGKGKTVIVEYSSPNIAKPFHIGHLRTTLIGHALYNTYKTLGYNTIRSQSFR